MGKRVKRKPPATPDIAVCQCPMFIYLSREVRAERALIRSEQERAEQERTRRAGGDTPATVAPLDLGGVCS